MPIDFVADSPAAKIDFTPDEVDLGSFATAPDATLISSPLTGGVSPLPHSSIISDITPPVGSAASDQPNPDVPAVEIGSDKPIELPRFGKEGTVLRGASEVGSGLVEWALNKPEEVLASMYPPTSAAVLARYAPGMAQQFAGDVIKGVQGDKEALGRAGAMAALVGLPMGAKEFGKAKAAAEQAKAEMFSADEAARKALDTREAPGLVVEPTNKPPIDFVPDAETATRDTSLKATEIPAPPAADVLPLAAKTAEALGVTEPKGKETGAPPNDAEDISSAIFSAMSEGVQGLKDGEGKGGHYVVILPEIGIKESSPMAIGPFQDMDAAQSFLNAEVGAKGAKIVEVDKTGKPVASSKIDFTPESGGGKEVPAAADETSPPAGQVEPAGTPARNWDAFYEDLVGDLDSFSPARTTGKRNYAMDDVAERFVENAKNATPGKPLDQVVSDFAKMDEATPSQIKKLRASVKNLVAKESPVTAETRPESGISVGPGAASPEDVPPPSGGEDVTGVAQRVREKMAEAGQETLPPRGKGISAADSVEHGRELLKSGADPEEALSQFEQTKRLSADDMAVVRAHAEKLAFDARRAEEKFGTDSDEFRAAQKARNEWSDRSKVMQTEWSRTGQAQQGEVDIDTGTFSGLASAYHDATGKDFTEGQAETAKKKAKAGKETDKDEAQAKDELLSYARNRQAASDADKAALDAANKVVIDWAVKKADMERKQQVIEAQRKLEVAKIERERDARVKALTDKIAVRNAIKMAKDAVKAANDRAESDKAAAAEKLKAERRAMDAANKVVRDNAIRKARAAAKDLEMDLPERAWKAVRDYIEKGMEDPDEIRNKVATDLGVPVKDVTAALGKDKRAKFLMDEAWKKQQTARLVKQQSKQWLLDTAIPGYQRAIQSIPKALFSLKVGFHGTVALGTHAPMVAFQPRFWDAYVRDFGKMYSMVGRPTPKGQANARAYYEMQIQDLVRRENYIVARRAGLINDPGIYEDFNSPDTSKYFGKLTTMGNRGYTVLKILRQDMFDQMWNKLPRTAKTADMAESMADGINHSTGVVKGKAPRGANLALFAPRLEASRVMWLAGDPLRAADTFLRWNKSSEAEKAFAINQVKEKAWVAGTLFSALALNQGFLSATGSNQKINGIPESAGGKGFDPFRSDFMKFKVAGMDFSYGNAMLSMARLPVRLYRIRSSDGGKLKNLVYPDEDTYTVLGQYARSQESPFASLATTLWLKADFQNRPLANSTRPVPKRLKRQGVEPYTWPEFWSEQVLPIPAEEAVREVWKSGLGMSDEQIHQGLKALATISVMAATGARLTDDVGR